MLSHADQERVHTQTIAWLLNPIDTPLNQEQLQQLYSSLFSEYNISINVDQYLDVITEYDHIDLVIAESKNIIAIENKLKSQQSDGQLAKYDETLEGIVKQGQKLSKFLLSFSDETPHSDDWNNLEYKKIYAAIASLDSNNLYVRDYQGLLKRMLEAKDYFLSDGCNRLEVIRRSGLPAKKRIFDIVESNNHHIKYICSNKLERLFVEIYYRTIMQKVGRKNWKVTESHGVALIQVYFEGINYKGTEIRLIPGFQLQKDTIKYNIHEESYKSSQKSSFPKEFIQLLETDFFKKENGFRKNEGKTKAYLSFSFPVDTDLFFGKDIQVAAGYIRNQILICEKKWNDVRLELANKKLILT